MLVAETADDVVEGVRLARDRGWKVAIRAGGHSFPAWSLRDDGPLIDLGAFKETAFDESTGLVSVTPSVSGGELNAHLSGYGRFFTTGDCPSLGLGGFLLQGGVGIGFRGWGYAAEQIASIDVVTADGELIRADEQNNSDLFWAARGAGPGFCGESAWVEPAATALRVVMFAGDLTGRSVLVVRGGPIGQLCCRLARHFGAGRVWLSEPSAERRSYAEASRVDRAFNPSVDSAELEHLKADAVLECSGSEPGMRGALAAARPEGTIVVVGGGCAGLDPLTILVKELRVLGCFTYIDEFTEVISLLTDGGLQVADLTSEIAGIDDAPAAFERLRDASTMKIFIAPNGS